MEMEDLSGALKNQLEFIAKLNADMAREAQLQQPISAAGTPTRVMRNDPVSNDAFDRLHVGNICNRKQSMSMEEEIDIEKVDVVKKEITPLAKRLAPALANVQKSVQVPVRQRTAQTRVGHAPEKKLTFLLPETPIESRRLEEQQSVMTPRVLGVGIEEEGMHGADASMTPGIKAGTPMAIEVLTNLYSLGLGGRTDIASDYELMEGMRASEHHMKGSQRNISNNAAKAAAGAATRRQRSKKGGPKTCNCKRSKCLKMYCECFSASGFCLPGCSCLGCKNTEENALQVGRAREGILMKDPAAFDDKVNKNEGHKKGCRCKRSKCLKKYCECYNAGVKCNPKICQCVDCCNEPGFRKNKKKPPMEPLENSKPSPTALQVEGVVEEKPIALQPTEGDENASPVNDMFSGEALAFLTPGRCADDVKANTVIPGDATNQAENALAESRKEKENLVEICEPGSVTFKPDSSALVSHFSPALPEMEDTATSPEYKLGAVKKVAFKQPTARRMTNVLSIPPSVRENLELPSSGGSKRPRRAASGGVSGAIAAARADWGLDHISPPLKRATSVPNKEEKSKGTASAAKKERNALLRKVLQQENGPAIQGQEDEADAISALVSLNSMG